MVKRPLCKQQLAYLAPAFLLLGALGVLVACSDQSAGQRNRPAATATQATRVAQPTATTDSTVLTYPWPMNPRQNETTGQTDWLPGDNRVYTALEANFLAYWTWSGQAGPAAFPFAPDPAQIPVLATPTFQGQLQTYVQQVQTTRQMIIYRPSGKVALLDQQSVQTCTPDGLTCQSFYTFDSRIKTICNTRTGAVIRQFGLVAVFFYVTQSYNLEAKQWQLSSLVSREIHP